MNLRCSDVFHLGSSLFFGHFDRNMRIFLILHLYTTSENFRDGEKIANYIEITEINLSYITLLTSLNALHNSKYMQTLKRL